MSKRLIGTRKWRPQKDTIGIGSPYMTRITWGRFRYHVFHRGDQEDHPHDHQWSFVTFPLTSYVEEVLEDGKLKLRVVKRFRFHYRHATYRHRVLGKWNGDSVEVQHDAWFDYPTVTPGNIHTLVVVSRKFRDWGFWPELGKCFIPWRDLVFKGRSACD